MYSGAPECAASPAQKSSSSPRPRLLTWSPKTCELSDAVRQTLGSRNAGEPSEHVNAGRRATPATGKAAEGSTQSGQDWAPWGAPGASSRASGQSSPSLFQRTDGRVSRVPSSPSLPLLHVSPHADSLSPSSALPGSPLPITISWEGVDRKVVPQRHVHFLTTRTCECDLIWGEGLSDVTKVRILR